VWACLSLSLRLSYSLPIDGGSLFLPGKAERFSGDGRYSALFPYFSVGVPSLNFLKDWVLFGLWCLVFFFFWLFLLLCFFFFFLGVCFYPGED